MSYAKLIINEEPLQLLPELAVAIGLNEAIVLQQLHYWMSPKKKQGKMADGRRWIKNSYTQWKEDNFPFWSEKVIGNIFRSLESKGVIDSRQDLNEDRFDQSKWYSINYFHPSLVQNGNIDDTHSGHSDDTHLGHSDSPDLDIVNKESENTTENTTENTDSDKSSSVAPSKHESPFEDFWEAYPRSANPGRHIKKTAKARFEKAAKQVGADKIMKTLEWQKGQADWLKDGGQFIPGAHVWLNREPWESIDGATARPAETNVSRPVTEEEIEWAKNHQFVPAFGHGWVERELERRKREQQEMDGLL